MVGDDGVRDVSYWWDFYMGKRGHRHAPPPRKSGGEEEPDRARAIVGAWARGSKEYGDILTPVDVMCESCQQRLAVYRRTFVDTQPLVIDVCEMCA